MKILTVILLSYLAALTVEPVAYKVYAMTKHPSCCGTHCCMKNKQCSESFPAPCNNCINCSVLMGAFMGEEVYKLQPQVAEKSFTLNCEKQPVSNYYTECFRPPRLV